MNDLLVNQVCNHLDGADTDYTIVSSVGPLKLKKYSVDKDLNDVWQLGVDDSNQCCKYMTVASGSSLGLHYRSSQKALSSQEVFAEELDHNIMNVCHIHFVNDTVDTLSKNLPLIFLVLRR